MVKSEQTQEMEDIFYTKQAYKRILKMHRPLCADKNYTWGCMSCQMNKFLKEFKEYIEWLESLYNWSYKNERIPKDKTK